MSVEAQSGQSGCNEVRLVGRLSAVPEGRVLPSGDQIVTFRVVTPRGPGEQRSRQTVDAPECVAWSARVRRTVGAWATGDVVEVEGSLRRRFYRSGTTLRSRVEVEVVRARRVTRRASG